MTDIVVIGGGIAGVSAAATLSEHADVTLLEKEAVLAYHSTGRSAALYFLPYGDASVFALTRASKPFLLDPPDHLVDGAILSPRGALLIARGDQLDDLATLKAHDEQNCFQSVTPETVIELQPVVRPDYVAAGLYDESAMDLDVAGLHQAYVRMFRANGGVIDTSAPALSIERQSNSWTVTTASSSLSADIVVNASGAWGDLVAESAGIEPVGLLPLRRTGFMVASDLSLAHTPATAAVDLGFYFKPDGTQMLCSLAEEVLDEPGDARPRELDVALAIDRINDATTLAIRHVRSSWTGLRTFAPDRAPVIGFDPDHDGFFWLVGHGGTGIQTAPASADLVAELVLENRIPRYLEEEGIDAATFSPGRLRAQS